jgi:tetratricopeptide (TPR) repeat protein
MVMAHDTVSDRVNDLFRRDQWTAARRLLEAEQKKSPGDHWVLTQLGVTFYEQKKYKSALKQFLASVKIVPTCPLTLWNLAGALDSLGNYSAAKDIYTWLLESTTSPEDDPCWESKAWTDALKADAVYRLGLCYDHLGDRRKADTCFRRYLDLLLAGIDGTYSAEDVTGRIRRLHDSDRANGAAGELRKHVRSALRGSGIGTRKGRTRPPTIDEKQLLAGVRAAAKR